MEDNLEKNNELNENIDKKDPISAPHLKILKDGIKDNASKGQIILSKEKYGGKKNNIYHCKKINVI